MSQDASSQDPTGAPPVGPFRMRAYWLALAAIAVFALWPLPFGLKSLAAVSLPMGALAAALWLVVLMIAWNAYVRRRAGVATASTARINFLYYALALAVILALGYATLSAWLPAPVLLLVAFAAIFWLFSFVFALVATLRRKSRAK